MLLFCYGSNHPAQLAARLGHDVEGRGAYALGYQRVFRGWSTKWEGGTASLVKRRGSATYGYVTKVTDADLKKLDRFEGLGFSYERLWIQITIGEETKMAIAYVSLSNQFSPPSRAYLEAIVKTVSPFWQNADSPDDYPIR